MLDKRSWPLVGVHSPIFQMGKNKAPRGSETRLRSQSREKSPNSKLHQEIILTNSVTQFKSPTIYQANDQPHTLHAGSHLIFQMGKLSLQEVKSLVRGHASLMQLG